MGAEVTRRHDMESGTQSVFNALRVIEQVSFDGTAGVSDLARRLGLPKSTVQRTLATLGAAGWLRQDSRSRWTLTLRCATIGRNVVPESAIRAAADPVVAQLRDSTGETVRSFLIGGDNLMLIATAESKQAVRPVESRLPGAAPLHATAIGKATLAAWPADEVERILGQPLAAVTSKTIIDPGQLRAEIDATRRRGWGQVDEELYLDVGGVAAVASVSEVLMIGVGVSYPIHRTPARTVTRLGRMAGEAAARIASLVQAGG